MFDSLDVSGSIVKLKTKDGKIYEYNNDKKELKKFEKPFNRDYKAAYYLYINREV